MQEALRVKPNTKFVGCSDKVASALAPDVMKTVKPLIPDLLSALPVLLYQGTPELNSTSALTPAITRCKRDTGPWQLQDSLLAVFSHNCQVMD